MGCNGWRTAHNCATESVLDACDRLGMLVMDENRHAGDGMSNHTPRGSTYTNLSDLAFMIQRDRNHPSVIMWSLCNEEGGLQRYPEGARMFSAMMDVVHRYDKTRPCTCAMHGGWTNNGFTTVEDIIGVNYHPQLYDEIHHARPHLPLFGSETTNDKNTRGEYADDPTNGWCSSYNTSDVAWEAIASREYVAGCYVWTGFDYKGEPNPYGWPDISNNTGLLDVCGFPKDRYYTFESWWSDKPMVHLMPGTWNWPGKEGKPIRVVTFSNARNVELFLNGKSLGVKTMPRNGHLEWEVPYAPGKLIAKASTDKKVVATDTVETTGPAARVELSPERRVLHADGQDTMVVPVSILDAQGRFVAGADNRVSFELSGGGKILGVGNGNPSDHDPDRARERNAFHGHCVVLIQAGTNRSALHLKATAAGLTPANFDFRVE
jgi:beta-galactosidase